MSHTVRIKIVRACGNAAIASEAALLAAGLTARAIQRLVAAGELRRGITGFWLPTTPDPGALRVMRAAIDDQFADD
jgi:hypothetical protein